MKLLCKWLIVTSLTFTYVVSFAQNTSKELSLKMFYKMILENHPVAKQAQNISELGKMEIRLAKGMLDPKLETDYTQKVFDGKQYFGYLDAGLKIPIWYGQDIKFGYENNTGKNINPTDFTPPGGLMYAGLHIPIGQGMLIDERRASIKQAQQMMNMAEAEKIKTINKLLFSASKEYWEWYFIYQQTALIKKSYILALQRANATAERAKQGDVATIDSVEAHITLQERFVQLQNMNNALQNSRLQLSNYLWNSDLSPLEIDTTLTPELNKNLSSITLDELKTIENNVANTNPELLKLQYKISHLNIERKLSADKLKPNFDLTLKYLTSNKNIQNADNLSWGYTQNNYKIMFTYSQPIFLRKERAKLNMNKIKLEQTNLDRVIAEREIHNLLKTNYNTLKTLTSNFNIQEKMVLNYQTLLEGEKARFENGESSIFMVNSRETKLIDGEIKLAELKSKIEKLKIELMYNSGTLNQ